MVLPLREELEHPEVVHGLTQDPALFKFPRPPLVVVGAANWLPHIGVTRVADGRIIVSGPMGNVLHVLAEKLNFTYSVVIPENSAWGSVGPNGSWSGMVGQVFRKEADLALGPFGISLSRYEVVDFTESLHYGDVTILSRKGEAEIDSWSFLYPLTETVWTALAAALVLAWVVTTMVARRPGYVTPSGWAGEIFLQHLRVFFNQGIMWKAAHGWAGQIVLGSWMVMAAVVFWSYTGNLTSLLAVRHIPQPIQTLRDLLDDSAVTLVLSPATWILDIIAKSEDGELREMYDLRKVGRVQYHSSYPLSKMRYAGESVLYNTLTHDIQIASYFQETQRCDFYKSKGVFTTNSHSMIIQKNSLLLEAVNYRVRAVVEAGLYYHWLQQEMPATTCGYAPSIITVREPLSLSNLWGLFVIFGVMLVLAVVVFLLELCVFPQTKTGP